jgi:hypothetical protein
VACGLPNRRERKAITKGFSAVYGLVSTAGKGLHVRTSWGLKRSLSAPEIMTSSWTPRPAAEHSSIPVPDSLLSNVQQLHAQSAELLRLAQTLECTKDGAGGSAHPVAPVDAQRSALSDNICDDLSCPSSESPANLARSSGGGESGQGLQPGSDWISEGGSDPLHACGPDDSDLPRCNQHVQSQEPPCGPMDGPGWV